MEQSYCRFRQQQFMPSRFHPEQTACSATLYFADHEDALVILDEVHRAPELFQRLRGVIDKGRRRGKGAGRFLLLGSAAMDLLQQAGESVAGRISYLELGPLEALEVEPAELDKCCGCAAASRAASWPNRTN